MKKFSFVFIPVVLSGCYVVPITPDQIALANLACEPNGGIKFLKAIDGSNPGEAFCVNGAKFYFNKDGVIK